MNHEEILNDCFDTIEKIVGDGFICHIVIAKNGISQHGTHAKGIKTSTALKSVKDYTNDIINSIPKKNIQ